MANILIGETTLKDALIPLNLTDVAPVKLQPLISTYAVSVRLDVGVNDVMVGTTLKLSRVVAVPPPRDTTEIFPELTSTGKVTVI